MIEINDLEKIIQVVDKYNISHFEFEHENSKVIIEKQEKTKRTADKSMESQINSTNETYLSPSSQENVDKLEDKNINETKIEKEYIKANFAGTFYSKRDSDSSEFAKLHDEVNCNTVVGLLEVMKLFNEVEAGVEGIIVDILVEDGQFVEYGQPLFEVKRGERYV